MTANRRRTAVIVLVLTGIAAAAQFGVLWFTRWPLGIPGEWTWARHQPGPEWWISLAPVLAAGALLWGLVVAMGTAIARRGAAPRGAVWGLAIVGLLWLLATVSAAPNVGSLQRVPFVLYYERTSGYFIEAKSAAADLPQFLLTYHERISAPDNPANYLHQGTHPPGLTCSLWLLLRTCERFPGLTSAVLATTPKDVQDAFFVLSQNEAASGRPLDSTDVATLWLAALLVAAASALTVVPLHALALRVVGREAAWWTAAFWLLVPASGVFLPKSDVMFAFLSTSALALWLRALERREILPAVLTGILMFVAVNLSLAFAPIGLILVVLFARQSDLLRSRTAWRPVIWSGLAFLLLLLSCWWVFQVNLLPIWRTNLQNHAAFYDHFTRTWWKWLLANPVELSFSLGLPLAVLSVIGLAHLVRQTPAVKWTLLVPCAVWAILWLSGKNRGEAARLWILLMPIAVWVAGLSVEWLLRTTPHARRWIPAIYFMQMFVCAATVTCVDGFHFSDFQ